MELAEGGRFAAYMDGPAKSVTVDGVSAPSIMRESWIQLDIDNRVPKPHTVEITR